MAGAETEGATRGRFLPHALLCLAAVHNFSGNCLHATNSFLSQNFAVRSHGRAMAWLAGRPAGTLAGAGRRASAADAAQHGNQARTTG